MGLIMLILIGTVPTAYALNRAMPEDQVVQFRAIEQVSEQSLAQYANGVAAPAGFREGVAAYVRSHDLAPETVPSLIKLSNGVMNQVTQYGSLGRVPVQAVDNVRNDMYLASEAIRLMLKSGKPEFDADTTKNLTALRGSFDQATKFIPAVGQGRGGDRARPRHHSVLEADRGDGRREDRQEPHDLRARRRCRTGGDDHHRRGRHVRPAGLRYARSVVGRCRHHGGQPLGTARLDRAQPADGLAR
jgi:hypothetical protein